ncbi:MAG: hypothetical protein ACI9OJ_005117, partial [Myxococcota bacterium]
MKEEAKRRDIHPRERDKKRSGRTSLPLDVLIAGPQQARPSVPTELPKWSAGFDKPGGERRGGWGSLGVMRQEASGASGALDPSAAIDSLRGSSGKALDSETRRRFETVLGHPLGHVRIHDDAAANAAAEAVQARAFARGAAVVFGPGEYRPNTEEGDRLLLHELSHVRQFARGPVPS